MKMSCSEEEEAHRHVLKEVEPSADESKRFRPDPGSSVFKGQTPPVRVTSAASSCGSMKSDRSKGLPENFRSGPGSSDSKAPPLPQGGHTVPVSLKSDISKEYIINFTNKPGSLEPRVHRQRKRRDVGEEEPSSCCASCQDVLKDPVSTCCGLRFCRRCIPSHWDQSAASGLCSCPLCGSRTADVGLRELLDEHQFSLRRRCEHATEESGRERLLNRIYTELYITEGLREEVQTQHEVRQLETSKTNRFHDAPIRNQDILKPLPDQHRSIRVVLTSGVAGAGKSFSVQKFTLDWAEGSENQDISAVVPLSFRELNLIRDEQHSLLTLIQLFHPTFQKIPGEQLSVWKLLFIFDGLDESRLSLDFSNSPVVSDVTHKSSINVLLINLIQGRLLPSALVWITSRPAAANQIPPSCVDRLTEVRGFNDVQKEEYFRRRFPDEELSSRIISHIKGSMSLYIMCEVPVFCWITAVVLENMLTTEQRGELPTTLTDMYSHFLMVQTKRKKKKYQQDHEKSPQELAEADREVLLKLGELAFEHLEKGNIMFYQEDLQQCGLDVTEASVYSGVCTKFFRRECGVFEKPVYSFVHLSVQEFLVAVYMFHCYCNRNTKVMEDFLKDQRNISSLEEFLSKVMEKSLQSRTGHLDLCVRFLHGLSVESNQRLLGGLLGQTEKSPETIQRIINNLKMVQQEDEIGEKDSLPWQMMTGDKIPPDRRINIYHCLMEMKDLSVHRDIQEFLKSENKSEKRLSEIHCSGLAYKLLISEEVLEELDLDTYNTTNEGRRRLIPAVRNCRKFRLTNCGLSEMDCGVVASALKSNPSHLTELDLSKNQLKHSAVELLCVGLQSPNCRLQILRLVRCSLLKNSCAALISSLKSNPVHLIELDLSNCDLHDDGLIHLSSLVKSPDCRLQTLRLERSTLSDVGFIALGSALQNNPSHLTELDLSRNKNLQDSGLVHLCGFLEDPRCHLRVLRLRGCDFSVISCKALVSALRSNPSHLVELDLRDNYLEDSGVQLLQDLVESPDFKLQCLSTESW